MAKQEADYTPANPTHIFNTSMGGVTVLTKLFGPVSSARLATEAVAHKHRLEQLQPPAKMTPAEEYRRFRMEERMERQERGDKAYRKRDREFDEDFDYVDVDDDEF